jgi:hypothetical protein
MVKVPSTRSPPGSTPRCSEPAVAVGLHAHSWRDHGDVGDALEWLGQLADDLAAQRRLLLGLRDWCEADPDAAWLAVGCSLARDAADVLSDLDVAIGVKDEHFDEALGRAIPAMAGLGDLVDCFDHRLVGLDRPHRRVFAQYTDRTQIDLVVCEASYGRLPGAVVLYDPQGCVDVAPLATVEVSPGQVREWACLAWVALADLGKYLRRASPWEALGRLGEARGHLWQLWATSQRVRDPQYGVTSVLDFAPHHLPIGMVGTVTGLDPVALLAAGRQLARLLTETQGRLALGGFGAGPDALARFVTADLTDLQLDVDAWPNDEPAG